MPCKQGKAIPEDNGPIPYQDKFGSREPTMADVYRIFEERFDRMDKNLERVSEFTGILRATKKRLAGLEQDARQPRLAAVADVETDKKTRKRTEGVAAADRAKYNGDSSSARGVDNGPTNSTSFSMIAEPLALLCRDDALVDKGTEAPKPCLSPVDMRTLTVPGDLLPAGIVFAAIRTIFP